MSRITEIIETLEAEKADLQQRLEWIELQLESFREHQATQGAAPAPAAARTPRGRRAGADATAAPAPAKRGRRLEKADRARSRRAATKSLRRDMATEITAHLAKHPGSTAGDVAKALDAKRNSVATKLTQMTKMGLLVKAERGYQVAPDGSQG